MYIKLFSKLFETSPNSFEKSVLKIWNINGLNCELKKKIITVVLSLLTKCSICDNSSKKVVIKRFEFRIMNGFCRFIFCKYIDLLVKFCTTKLRI